MASDQQSFNIISQDPHVLYLCWSGYDPYAIFFFLSGSSPSGLDPDTASGMDINDLHFWVKKDKKYRFSNLIFAGN